MSVVLITTPLLLKAQWNTNTFENIQVSGLKTADMQSVRTSDGKMWVAFYHENTGNYDMRAQLIDADGYKLLGPDGVLVSNKPSGSAIFVFNACVDNNNNLIIGCQDERTGTMQSVIYKISPAGTHLWSSDGVIVGNGLAPWPAALSNNEIVVAWNGDNTIEMQKFSSSGTAVWANPVSVMVSSSTTTRGQIVANTNNKFTLVYQKRAAGISTTLYAQHFDSNGTPLYAPLQICNQTTSGARYYSISAEADTTYFGYYSSSGMRFNSFAQRINPNGTIPWGMNGSAFNTSVGGGDSYQGETSIGLENGSPFVWSVCTFSDPNQTNYGVYVQKFAKSNGARQFTDQAKVVYAISSNRDTRAGEIAIIDDTPMFATYNTNYKIRATRLNGSGDFAWSPTSVELSSTTAGMGNPKGRYGFSAINGTRCSAFWTEDRGSGDFAYAQGVTIGGLIGLDVATQGSVPASITTGGGTLQMTATIYPASASQAVVWSIVPVTGSASISTSGLVTAISDGTVWAKAVAVQDITLKDSVEITISGQIPVLPDVLTLPATDIGLFAATIHGSVDANNFSSSVSFEWGLTNSYGNTITPAPAVVGGNIPVSVQASLTSLSENTTYHFRCVATNAAGTIYGADEVFTTDCQLPGTISSISGPSTVCAGSAGNIYSVDPIANATLYNWTIPQGATITSGDGTNSITVSFQPSAVSGQFTVFASSGSCYTPTSNPLSVTVLTLPLTPGPILGTQLVCEGEQNVQYSVTPLSGTNTYNWTVPSGVQIISGQGTNIIIVSFNSGAVAGNITVSATNSCGNGPVSAPLFVDVAPLPATPGAISGPTIFCSPATNLVYSVAPVANAYGYVWTVPSGATINSGANTNTITVTFSTNAVSGDILVRGTNGNCLGAQSAPLAVTVNPTPPQPVVSSHGDTLISSSETGNQWYLDGTAIPGATGKKHVAVYAGYYSVQVTLNDCASVFSNSVLILPVGLPEPVKNSGFVIFPNPSNGNFSVEGFASQNDEYNVSILNNLGAIVWRRTALQLSGNYNFVVDANGLKAGSYTVELSNSKTTSRQKLIITR